MAGILSERGEVVNYFSLEQLPEDFPKGDLYGNRTPAFQKVMDEHFKPATKFVLVVPEYNASLPGIMKILIDALPQDTFAEKKVALVGTSTGRGGNIRGIDHLTNILHYLKANVFSHKVIISSMLQISDENGIRDERIVASMEEQARLFIEY